ncbi:Protein sel-1 1 [Clonorchis sinensis]|uniref:Protein sel-1 1 n=1 Tax=Clonorchis sinensis TaxID=79923 RepID=A0A3R7GBD6_CLOSI|nr:Protein sel-1 1 [Clonorchis sinensis]
MISIRITLLSVANAAWRFIPMSKVLGCPCKYYFLWIFFSYCAANSLLTEDNEAQKTVSQNDEKVTSGVPEQDSPIADSESADSVESKAQAKRSDSDEPEEPAVPAKSEAQRLYEEGMKILDEGDTQANVRKIAFQFLHEAAERGHTQAREWVALGTLLGWGFFQSLPRAHADFTQLAQEGNPRGQFGLGLMYASGLLVNASIPHALIYLTFGALGGDDLAEMALAYRYWTGTGLEESCESALTYYYRVAKKVSAQVSQRAEASGSTLFGPIVRRARLLDEADANTGLLNMLFGFGAGNGDQALGGLAINEDLFQYYQFLADKKNLSAQVGLGQFYYYGRHGVEKNLEKAFYYFKLASEAGSSLAKAYLGEMYMTGTDTLPADPEKGLKYLRQSAEDDNPIGQTGLAMAYLHGKAGLSPNPLKAMELLFKAADQGWADAQLTLGRMFMGTLGAKADYKLAVKYFTMASQQGNVLAFFYLGEMHATGLGVLRSCTTAAELFKNVAERGRWSKWFMYAHSAYRARRYDEAFVTYQLLAELGYEVAQSNVAFMLEEGKITVVDKEEFQSRALVQWRRSALQGVASSRVKLGDYYYYGWGTEVDYMKAVQHYRIASELHQNSQAMFNLAYMHEQGLGLKRDIHLAKRYYDLATEASLDAKVPVALALLKLSVSFWSEYLRASTLGKYFGRIFGMAVESSGRSQQQQPVIGTTANALTTMDWDYYAIPILAGALLALIVYLWHERRR